MGTARTRNGSELLDQAEALAADGDSAAALARRTGGSRKTIANQIRVATNLAPELKKLLRTDRLKWHDAVNLAGHPPDEQRRLVRHKQVGASEKPIVALTMAMSKGDIQRLRRSVRQSTESAEWKVGALVALECVLGGFHVGIWPP